MNYNDERFPGPDPYAALRELPAFDLESRDFQCGERLPDQLVGNEAKSPHLSWANLPEGTKSLAVTCFDPDAPTASGYWHWAAFDIPTDLAELPRDASSHDGLGVGARSLSNDAGQFSYYGANPPEGHGPHRYLFAVHAVDVEHLDIPENATPAVLGFNLYFHSLGRAVLWGWHEN